MTDLVVRVEQVEVVRIVEIFLAGPQAANYSLPAFNASETIPDNSFVTITATGLKVSSAADGTLPVEGYVAVGGAEGEPLSTLVAPALITGLTNLVAGDYYYLALDGTLTGVPPSGDGNLVQYVGKAVSETSLLFSPDQGIIL